MNADEKAAFTVKVDEHEYNIWADGRIEGFANHRPGEKAQNVTIFNRIPQLIRDSANAAPAQDVRMHCVSLAMGAVNGPNFRSSDEEAVNLADALAQYVLTGNKPGAEA